MRYSPVFAVMFLPLAGCVVASDQGGYGYPTARYQTSGYVEEQEIYPGYHYNDGAPTIIVEGAPLPLTTYRGSWGYYDRRQRWQPAPEPVWRHIEQRQQGNPNMRMGNAQPYRPPPPPPAGYDRSPRSDWRGPQDPYRPASQPPRESQPPPRDNHGYPPRQDRRDQ